jgi:hypothetical protein
MVIDAGDLIAALLLAWMHRHPTDLRLAVEKAVAGLQVCRAPAALWPGGLWWCGVGRGCATIPCYVVYDPGGSNWFAPTFCQLFAPFHHIATMQ